MNYYINPYNFVPLGKKAKRSQYVRPTDEQALTGEIDCTLTIKTPLAMPDSETKTENQDWHTTYKFFSVNEKSIIPGSELRGMIRNVYEIITDSCFSVVNSNYLSMRVSKPNLPVVLRWNKEKGKWELFNAKMEKIPNNDSAVKRTWILAPNQRDFRENVSFFCWSELDRIKSIKDDSLDSAVEDLKKILSIYAKNVPDKENIFKAVSPEKDGGCYPAFYCENNSHHYLAPAQISRRMFKNRVDGLLGSFKKCDFSDGSLCSACSLFGTVTNNRAVSSRVRFSDAIGDDNVKLTPKPVTLKELSSPKITSVEFYSFLQDQNLVDDNENMNRWDYDEEGIILRGRKFYFHIPEAAQSNASYADNLPKSKTNRNSSMFLAKEGCFHFNVFFDGVTQDELKNLLWSLTLGDNSAESELALKLGHGKPLGLGSVKVCVDRVTLRSFSEGAYKLENKKFNDFDVAGLNVAGIAIDGLKAMCNFNYAKGFNVAYPVGDDGKGKKTSKNTMQWFVQNHGGVGRNKSAFRYVLMPVVTKTAGVTKAKNLQLPELKNYSSETGQQNPRPSNGNNQHSEKICVNCGVKFETSYQGSNPLCGKCKNKKRRY